jgi:hypothetical protein
VELTITLHKANSHLHGTLSKKGLESGSAGFSGLNQVLSSVMPAQEPGGILEQAWIPAFAGMTNLCPAKAGLLMQLLGEQ